MFMMISSFLASDSLFPISEESGEEPYDFYCAGKQAGWLLAAKCM
jgi:hypothetical protein